MHKFFTAIGFDGSGKAYKYRNIQNKPISLQRFESFCQGKGINYVNYYCKVSRRFIMRKIIPNAYNAANTQ